MLRAEGYSERALFVIDRYGIIQYIDIHDIDLQPDNDVLRQEIRRIDPIAAAREPKEEKPAPAPLPKGGIVLYCTTWCPDCRRSRLWLKEHGLPFTEVDIYAVPGAAEQLMKWTGGVKTTPAFDIDDTIIIKFDEARLREVLKDRLKE